MSIFYIFATCKKRIDIQTKSFFFKKTMHIIIYVYDFVLFDNGLAWIPFMP